MTTAAIAVVALPSEQDKNRSKESESDRGFDRIGHGRTSVSAAMLGEKTLREASPEVFVQFVGRFSELLHMGIEERTYELEAPEQYRQLQRLADDLSAFRVGPQDLVEIYHQAVAEMRLSSVEDSRKLEAYREEARVMLIGLMGFIMASYRLHVVENASHLRETG